MCGFYISLLLLSLSVDEEAPGSPPGNTWVKVRPLANEDDAENDDGQSGDAYPVFVSVLKAERPSPDALQQEVEQLTTAVAQLCQRPQKTSTSSTCPKVRDESPLVAKSPELDDCRGGLLIGYT